MKKKMVSKKGLEFTLTTIVTAALLLIAMVILIVLFAQSMGSGKNEIDNNIDNSGDKDEDGIPDMIDPCKGENLDKGDEGYEENCPGVGNWE